MLEQQARTPSTHLVNRRALLLLIMVLVVVAGFKIAYSFLPTYTSETENLQRELSDAAVVKQETQSPDEMITELLNRIRVESKIAFSQPSKTDNVISMTATSIGTIPEIVELFFKSEGFFLVENQSSTETKYYNNDYMVCQLRVNGEDTSKLKIGCIPKEN